MPDKLVEYQAGSGNTLRLILFELDSEAPVNGIGDVGTEATNRKRLYVSTVTAVVNPVWHHAHIFDANGHPVTSGYVKLKEEAGTYRVLPFMVDIESGALPEVASPLPANPTLNEAMMALYQALRNELQVTAGQKVFHDDAGSPFLSKLLTYDGTTYTENKGT